MSLTRVWPWMLGGAFGLVLLTALAATAPLALALKLSGVEASGVSYSRAVGTLWNGRIEGVVANGYRLGDIGVSARFWPLLTGRLSAEISVAAQGLVGSAAVSVSGQRIVARDGALRADIAHAGGLDPRLRGRPGAFTLDIGEVVWDETGCIAAEGRAWTDALTHGDPRSDWRGPELSGPVGCDGADLLIAMTGVETGASYAVEARLTPLRAFRVHAEIESGEPALSGFLPLLGFVRDGSSYVYDWPRR